MSSVGSVTSSPARSSISASLVGPSSVAAAVGGDDFHFPADLISIQDRKDEALRVLKSDLIATLSKEVKSLDEDSWMFDGPRSRIHLISRPGGVRLNNAEIPKHDRMAPPK
ncbi:SAMBA isoform X1 [Olea europaea subsp. europaea]|uniref:SAMBA isoform X1 n=1 Tax=Olea europaea subsp. europaea TaxID=158383 RepID=A0A8S0TZY9_OLEEU|nr:SAMBA isoform X1 [Olea europaea subsp. europaea]